jgi:hypothetical protein
MTLDERKYPEPVAYRFDARFNGDREFVNNDLDANLHTNTDSRHL